MQPFSGTYRGNAPQFPGGNYILFNIAADLFPTDGSHKSLVLYNRLFFKKITLIQFEVNYFDRPLIPHVSVTQTI